MKKMTLILNPYAGTKKANKILPELIALFNRADYDVTTYITDIDGAKAYVANNAKNVDLVVCCGGDGTFNETVSGILESGADIPIGYIPTGSTNDFASSLGLPLTPLEAAKRIIAGQPESYDVGSFGGRAFTYVASFGAFTKSSYATPQSVKNLFGHTAYVLSGISELSQIKNLSVKMELDGEILEGDFVFGAISNSTSIGGIVTLDPSQVNMADGLFEVMLVKAPKDLMQLAECITAVNKGEYNCAMITFRTAKNITIHSDGSFAWTLDGEMEPGKETVEVQNLYRAIRLMK